MSWQSDVKSAETVLQSVRIPPAEEIIALIKRINPTSLQLCETDREHGYGIKNRLQNLLLENYGQAFHLVSHPLSPDIILIKHSTLPSIDACHADRTALSVKALDTVGDADSAGLGTSGKREARQQAKTGVGTASPREILRNAEALLQQYEYPRAEEMLASLRIGAPGDVATLVKAARVLVEEMGAYQRGIELILAQPRHLLKDRAVRELLALAYHRNGMIPEARALLDREPPGDLGKDALCAFADISFRDGNLSKAYHLVRLSEEKEGFVAASAALRKDIEAAMLEEAAPPYHRGEAMLAAGDPAAAESQLRQALACYPNFQKARQLLSAIEAGRNQAQMDRLWERFETAATAAQRLDLLAQLLERDKAGFERISDLMAQERARQQRETAAGRLETLQALSAQGSWVGCFDLLLWFSRQGDEESYRTAMELNPLFSVLNQNRKLLRLGDQAAKELWLRFVKLSTQFAGGHLEGCWNQAQELKEHFYAYPLFKAPYDKLLEREQESARDEIDALLERLRLLEPIDEDEDEDEDEGDGGRAIMEGRRLVARIRKRSIVLAAEESARYRETAELRLLRLESPMLGENPLLDFRDSLLLGNAGKAAQIREAHREWAGAFSQVEEQVTQDFAIAAEPMTLTMSTELAVDLATDSAPPVWSKVAVSYRHLIFRQDDETLVIVNLARQSATRYRSPNFKSLAIMDFLPEQDVFLFVDMESRKIFWRAILSDALCRFTATFDLTEHFVYQPGATMPGLFMSSTKDNDYYAFFGEDQRMRGVRQSIGVASCVVSSFELAGEARRVDRLSYQPDRFILSTATATAVVESNLAPVKRCSRIAAGQELPGFGIDPIAGRIYVRANGIAMILDHKLYGVKQYHRATTFSHLQFESDVSICVEQDTLLANVDGRGIFYDMETNKFSQKFCQARFAHTETPSRWYYWDFDPGSDTVFLRDITDEVPTLLEWQVMLPPEGDEAEMEWFAKNFNDPDYFSIVKPPEAESLFAGSATG